MSDLKFEFKPRKAIEAILYVAERTKDTPTRLRIAKLLYLADKTSLEKYGRFIFGDTYHAMKHGPVPSHALDLLKTSQDAFDVEENEGEHPIIRPKRKANIELLSISDKTCLDIVLKAYDDLPSWGLRNESHDDAWEVTYKQALQQGVGSLPIPLERIVNLLEDSEDLLNYLENLNS
jgi:uncharacterized phage-associated protein